jgi:RNA polymerase sigma-70 factor (ECF subfamily)
MSTSERDLVEAAKSGDRRAMERLLGSHQARVFRFGKKMCRDDEDAADVLQETLLAAARTLPDFRGASSISTWLYTIARSFCIKKRWTSEFAPAALDALEPMYREVLVPRDVEGLPAADVAEALGLTVEAVKSRLHRARMAVRERVAPVLSLGADGPPAASCRDVVELFSQRMEGEIDGASCAELERHLQGCPVCRGRCDSLRATLALCRKAGVVNLRQTTCGRLASGMWASHYGSAMVLGVRGREVSSWLGATQGTKGPVRRAGPTTVLSPCCFVSWSGRPTWASLPSSPLACAPATWSTASRSSARSGAAGSGWSSRHATPGWDVTSRSS